MYGSNFDDLYGGEKAAVTKRYKAQAKPKKTVRRAPVSAPAPIGAGVDAAVVKFGRPGINGTKESVVVPGTTVEKAAEQAGMKVNLTKEGFVVKESSTYEVGQVLIKNQELYDGDLIFIVTGVDSN